MTAGRGATMPMPSLTFRRIANPGDLAEHAYALRHSEGGGLEFARLALVSLLRARDESPGGIDLLARAWLILGNALRINGKLPCAREALDKGETVRQGGTLSVELRLMSLLFLGSLENDARRLDNAERCLLYAEEVALGEGLPLEVTRARVKRAIVAVNSGEPARAYGLVLGALRSREGGWTLDLKQSAYEVAMAALVLDGRPVAALQLYNLSQPMYEGCGDLMRLKLRWVAAQIDGLFGRSELLAEVRDDYLSRDMSYEAALVTLDLAACAARRRETEVALARLGEAEPILAVHGLRAESVTAGAIRALRAALLASPRQR